MSVLIKHARPTGLGHQMVSGPGGVVEHETFTCGHCPRVTRIPHKADPATCGGMCKHCQRLVCAACASVGRCTPLEKRLETNLRRERFLSKVG